MISGILNLTVNMVCLAPASPPQDESPTTAKILEKLAKNDPILLFGYTHREKPEHPSAIATFAKEILPAMKKKGYLDLVVEFFPVGEYNDPIEVELREFNRTGKMGTEMKRFIDTMDRRNFEQLLNTAHKLGIKIHSGGVDWATRHETILHSDFILGNPEAVRKANEQIVENSKNRIISLKGQRKLVFALNGCLHNDLDPLPGKAHKSYGKIIEELDPNVLEVDLVIPELSEERYYRDLPLSELQRVRWKDFIPQQGINLIQGRTSNTHLIFWPWREK